MNNDKLKRKNRCISVELAIAHRRETWRRERGGEMEQ